MSDWISRITGNGTAPWYLTVALIASCIGILSSIAILYRSYKYISERLLQRRKRMYITGITTKEYIDWERQTLRKIYQSKETVGCLGSFVKQGQPAIAKIGADNVVYKGESDEFVGFTTELPSDLKDVIDRELLYTRLPHYRQFRAIVSDQVHFPELVGYANEKVLFRSDDPIKSDSIYGFTARPRTYKETVFSCHVLQYELWRAFLKKKRLASLLHSKSIPEARLKDLPLRDLIHNGKFVTETIKGKTYDKLVRDKEANGESAERLYEVVFDGSNRSSLCDVNLVILKRITKDPNYKKAWGVAVGRRSENVATFPGYWSIVPSGSFEMSEKTITPKTKYNRLFLDKLDNNKNVAYALYREYLEEVFNLSDYEHPNGDNDMYQLKNNDHIKALKKLEKEGKADLIFLGVCFDLIVLRQTISFALVVQNYSLLQNVRHNDENAILDFVSLEELEQIVQYEDAVMPELAGTYELLNTNETVRALLTRQEDGTADART